MADNPLVGGELQPRADVVAASANPHRIGREIRDIVDRLGTVFQNPMGLPVKTLQVALTITAEGSVGFLGTGGKLTGEEVAHPDVREASIARCLT